MKNEKTKYSKWAIISGVLGILSAIVMLMAGYGYQWGLWQLGMAFSYLLPGSVLLAILGLTIAVVSAFVNRPDRPRRLKWMAFAGAFFSLAVLGNAGYWFYESQQYPPIHDITTDTNNPPQFDDLVLIRSEAPNPIEYGGEEVADTQRKYYPDIQTLYLEMSYSQAFEQALEAAREMPWEEIVSFNKEEGRIEATDKLPWFGFKDDIVIRVDTAETTDRSKVDVRSLSRIGKGDIGVNAHRIRHYLQAVQNVD